MHILCNLLILSYYSNSMVLGGLEVTSYTTRLIPLILFTIWLEMFCKKDFSNLKK